MVQSVIRALNLLDCIGRKGGRASISELSKEVNLPPSTIHRLLNTMKEEGYLENDENSNMYQLGPKLLVLGLKVRGTNDLLKISRPVLEELTSVTKEDSYITIAQGDYGVFLECIKGPHPLKIIEKQGELVPLHCGAMRKVLLAHQSDEFIRNYLSKVLVKFNENTIVNASEMWYEIELIRSRGYATSFEEYTVGGSGVAVPIKDLYGKVIASVGLIVPTSRFGSEQIEELINEVIRTGVRLSELLGYSEVKI